VENLQAARAGQEANAARLAAMVEALEVEKNRAEAGTRANCPLAWRAAELPG
jgi:hypothetical protein